MGAVVVQDEAGGRPRYHVLPQIYEEPLEVLSVGSGGEHPVEAAPDAVPQRCVHSLVRVARVRVAYLNPLTWRLPDLGVHAEPEVKSGLNQ